MFRGMVKTAACDFALLVTIYVWNAIPACVITFFTWVESWHDSLVRMNLMFWHFENEMLVYIFSFQLINKQLIP